MPIPSDPSNRWWVDVSNENPHLVNDFRPTLVGLLAFDHGNAPSLAGSGFVIAVGTNPKFAVVISAKHVVQEGVLNIQRPVPRHAPSALFVPESSKTPSIHKDKLRAVWLGSNSADALTAWHLSYNDSLDLACCIFAPQESHQEEFRPTPIPLDTTKPAVGDIVHMVSQGGMDVLHYSSGFGSRGLGQTFVIHKRINIRVGVVTAVYPQGFRQYRWPCFTTSIPAEAGMSGGFVFLPRDGVTIAACGIVCADNSNPAAEKNYMLCGESVIANAWPALSLVVPTFLTNGSPMRTLYDMMQAGHMPKAIGGIDHIQVIDAGNGEFTLVYKDK